jgi:hypothetical protein
MCLYVAKKTKDKLIQYLVQCTLSLFATQFRVALLRLRKKLLYFVIRILTEPFIRDGPMIRNKQKIEQVKQQIHFLFQEVKQKETHTSHHYNNINDMDDIDEDDTSDISNYNHDLGFGSGFVNGYDYGYDLMAKNK